jgi:predicted nucleotidyltransferase
MKVKKNYKQKFEEKLNEITEKLQKIPEIIGIFYTGSTATQNWSKYSDLDIDIVVRDKDYKRIIKKLPIMMANFGKLKLCNHYQGIDETYGFYDKDYFKLDLCPIKESDLRLYKNEKKKIVFDKEDKIKKLMGNTFKKKHKIDKKEIVHLLLDTRSNFLYIVRHYAKGKKYSGVSEITGITEDLFYLLAKIKGLEVYELKRNYESVLNAKEKKLVENCNFHSFDKKELKRAIMACWKLMKYIEVRYENKYGKLNLKCNDEEILRIIDKPL